MYFYLFYGYKYLVVRGFTMFRIAYVFISRTSYIAIMFYVLCVAPFCKLNLYIYIYIFLPATRTHGELCTWRQESEQMTDVLDMVSMMAKPNHLQTAITPPVCVDCECALLIFPTHGFQRLHIILIHVHIG